jgi:hypothetical protein
MTPAETSLVDQALAEFSREVDRFVEVQRQLAPRRGREQASADICALLNSLPHQQVSATLAAAILRLAEQDGE